MAYELLRFKLSMADAIVEAYRTSCLGHPKVQLAKAGSSSAGDTVLRNRHWLTVCGRCWHACTHRLLSLEPAQ